MSNVKLNTRIDFRNDCGTGNGYADLPNGLVMYGDYDTGRVSIVTNDEDGAPIEVMYIDYSRVESDNQIEGGLQMKHKKVSFAFSPELLQHQIYGWIERDSDVTEQHAHHENDFGGEYFKGKSRSLTFLCICNGLYHFQHEYLKSSVTNLPVAYAKHPDMDRGRLFGITLTLDVRYNPQSGVVSISFKNIHGERLLSVTKSPYKVGKEYREDTNEELCTDYIDLLISLKANYSSIPRVIAETKLQLAYTQPDDTEPRRIVVKMQQSLIDTIVRFTAFNTSAGRLTMRHLAKVLAMDDLGVYRNTKTE